MNDAKTSIININPMATNSDIDEADQEVVWNNSDTLLQLPLRVRLPATTLN